LDHSIVRKHRLWSIVSARLSFRSAKVDVISDIALILVNSLLLLATFFEIEVGIFLDNASALGELDVCNQSAHTSKEFVVTGAVHVLLLRVHLRIFRS
jgi:hypothetical protein